MKFLFILCLAWLFVAQFINGDENIPFTHDFNTGLHGWKIGKESWHWTGGHYAHYPSRHFIPSFHSNGHYLWTENSVTGSSMNPANVLNRIIYYETVYGVTKQTQFHVKYFMYTTEPQCAMVAVYFFDKASQPTMDNVKITSNQTTAWSDLIVDCQVNKCCDEYSSSCDIRLMVMGSVGCYTGSGFIAVESISATGVGVKRSNWSKFWSNWTTGPKAIIWVFVASILSSLLGTVCYLVRQSNKVKKEDRSELI
ncbi:hypothetical protein CHUAL_008405 [Chamberlinius hualienensis]